MKRVKKFLGVYSRESARRRHNGRPDVCFYVTIKFDGKKKYIKIGWKSDGVTAAFASQRRAELLNQLKLGEQPRLRAPDALSLAEAWQLYYDNHVVTNTKNPRKTLSRWNSLLADHLGDSLLSEITPLVLENYKSSLQALGKSPKTIEHGLSLVRRIYKKMIAWDKYHGLVPTDRVEWPRYDNRRDRWLTPAEARALMTGVRDRCRDRGRAFWRVCMVALYTGMRFGEIASLSGECVNLAAGTIRVVETKSGRDRTVYVTGALAPILAEWPVIPGHVVFPNQRGQRRTEPSETFARVVADLGLNQGIDDNKHKIVFHSLRHTFGSWLAQAGVPLYWIAKLMGHTNEDVTERYSHLCPDVQRQAVECIDVSFHSDNLSPGLWYASSGSQNTEPVSGGNT